MISKYSIARTVIDQIQQHAAAHGLDAIDVQEATMILLIQALKESRGSDTMRGLLQYEIDSLAVVFSRFNVAAGTHNSPLAPPIRRCFPARQATWPMLDYPTLPHCQSYRDC